MPLLRSQTRGEAKAGVLNDLIQQKPLSSSLPTVITSIQEEEQLLTNTSKGLSGSPAISSTTPASTTMFPFPPAPVLSNPNVNSSIIDIINASSSSASEDSESPVSSCPNSPELVLEDREEAGQQSELLNVAMVESELEEEREESPAPTLQEITDDLVQSPQSGTFRSSPSLSQSAPSLLAHSVVIQQQPATSSLVYNLDTEPVGLQDDRDHSLQLCLQQFHCYDDEAGMRLRAQVVGEMDTLVKQWIRSEGLKKRISWSLLEQIGGKVVSFGSFKLSVVDRESDLDLLCVLPKLISRENFFSTLYDQLLKKEEVTELRQLPDAYVPVIKMKYRGLEVDLTMARVVSTNTIPEDETFLMKDEVTREMDPKCVRSLNGYRATCEILQLVPDVDKFRLVLRVVKLWAKKQGLYGNMLGFLGGASWAILVAKACQMGEGQTSSVLQLIYCFFYTFATWEWPNPVYIKKVEVAPYPAWNPKINPRDADHCMPIITTSQPQMNSAFNMCRQNCQLIQSKCQEAVLCLATILAPPHKPWAELFTPRNFFEEFEHYLMVISSCHGDSSLWFGSVESKLRQLAYHLMFNSKVATVRVWPQPFIKQEGAFIRQMWFFGIRMCVGYVSPDTVTEPLYTFEDLCKLDASKLYSPFSSSFHASTKYLTNSQLSLHLSQQQLSLGRTEKLSYAAVTVGPTSTPMVLTNMQSIPASGFVTSVPVLSPAQSDQGPSHHYNRVYQTPLTGLGGMSGVINNQNFIVYSISGSQHPSQPIIDSGDQKNLLVPKGSLREVRTFPTNRSSSSPQPGGYPGRQTPITPSGSVSPALYPGPGQVMGRKFQPPHSISPMSQFNSPPPSINNKLLPQPQPGQTNKSEDRLQVRTTKKRQKESFSDVPDRLRSVSNSSDKFPPPSLNRARVSNQDQLPLLSPSYSCMAGVRPLVNNLPDTSVPPPSLPTPPPTLSPPVSFNLAKKNALRSNRSPRVSISEISDVTPPQPVGGCRTNNNQIKFSLSSRSRPEDNVFNNF